MKLLPIEKLGPREKSGQRVAFGLFLPGISPKAGYRLFIKIIHEKDQFLQNIQPLAFELQHCLDSTYGDYWATELEITPALKQSPLSSWGEPGRYVYRYFLENSSFSCKIDWIIDPFAREFGIGKLSAFTLGYENYRWSAAEAGWKTPDLHDLIIYELMLGEFAGSLERAVEKLDYLQDLGINCLEIMPVSNVSGTIDWGYQPLGYFGVDERFGKRKDLQSFIDNAHRHEIAVVFDVVYGHTSSKFPYCYVYRQLWDTYGQKMENPFMGNFARDYYGESTDFTKDLTRDFFFTANCHWLECYHADGFRYDCVPDYWDGAIGQGYANLTYHTYKKVQEKLQRSEKYWNRFQNGQEISLIQCAEQLENPREILQESYSNCAWQNETLDAFNRTSHGDKNAIADLGLKLGLWGYPDIVSHNEDKIPKNVLHYIENHDHARFICNFGLETPEHEDIPEDKKKKNPLSDGNRENWYKVQPYVIALFTAKGIPLLWQGQELVENYFVPEMGWERVMLYRPVRWEYFYDTPGQGMIRLVRKLCQLRKTYSQFRRGSHYFYDDYERYQSRQIMIFSREDEQYFSLIALNFGDEEQEVAFRFPCGGDFIENLHNEHNISIVSGEEQTLKIPGNYGRIWTCKK